MLPGYMLQEQMASHEPHPWLQYGVWMHAAIYLEFIGIKVEVHSLKQSCMC